VVEGGAGAGTSSADDETPAPRAVGDDEEKPMIDETRIRDWLAAYHHAWTTDDPEEVARLFTDDILFYNAPFMEPLTGVDRVTEYWLDEAESGIPWSFEYQVLAQEGDLFVVRAVTTYPEGTLGADAAEVFHNLWLVTLDDERASQFVEYYMLVP
jgi:ketosteroid isomerase-like protein